AGNAEENHSMNIIRAVFLAAAALAVLTFVRADDKAPAGKGIGGTWLGALKVGGQELRLVVRVGKKPDGTFTGSLDSIDQGAKELAIEDVTLKDGQFRFELKVGKAVFEGKLKEDGSEIVGQ